MQKGVRRVCLLSYSIRSPPLPNQAGGGGKRRAGGGEKKRGGGGPSPLESPPQRRWGETAKKEKERKTALCGGLDRSQLRSPETEKGKKPPSWIHGSPKKNSGGEVGKKKKE